MIKQKQDYKIKSSRAQPKLPQYLEKSRSSKNLLLESSVATQSKSNVRIKLGNISKPLPVILDIDLSKDSPIGPSEKEFKASLDYFSIDSFVFLKNHEEKVLEYRSAINKVKGVLNRQLNCLKKSIDVNELRETCRIVDYCDSTQCPKVILGAYKLVSTLLFEYKETAKSLEFIRIFKGIARWFEDLQAEMTAYELMGKCMNSLFRFSEAEKCFSKMLKFALIIGDSKSEFRAYDLLSQHFFHMNKPLIAAKFHNKLIEGEFEPASSPLRKSLIPAVDQRMGYFCYISTLAGYESIENINLDDLVSSEHSQPVVDKFSETSRASSFRSNQLYGFSLRE